MRVPNLKTLSGLEVCGSVYRNLEVQKIYCKIGELCVAYKGLQKLGSLVISGI